MISEHINVLLVDDDAAYAGLSQHLMNRFPNKKFNIVWKENGDSALQELKTNQQINIVLVDYNIPEKNGLEIIKEIREEKISIPIILLTSSKNFKVAVEAMKYDVEDYLVKEEAVDTLLPRTILAVLERVKIKKQIESAEKEKILSRKRAEAIRELIVTICHEFNNPLAAIKISTDIIARRNISPEMKEILDQLVNKLNIIEKEIATLRDLDISELKR